MSKKIGQVRWFGENKTDNYPRTMTLKDLRCGTMLPRTDPLTSITIQAPVGTSFYLNTNPDFITIGKTGTYSLDVSGAAVITSIQFTPDAVERLKNATVIIDYVSEIE